MTARVEECRRLLRMPDLWGKFNRDMRVYWLAQRERCPYCGHKIPLTRHAGPDITSSTWDHVFPRSRWAAHRRAYVICHSACNTIKGNRNPHPCEVLYRDFTNDIVFDILPKN